MLYRRLTDQNDADIPYLLSVYRSSDVSRYISIDEENYWRYVTTSENVRFYEIYKDGCPVATLHCELQDRVLYMSVAVIPEHRKKGIGTEILSDVQHGHLQLDFDRIQVSIDKTNTASIRLFEKTGFCCVSENDGLLEYVYTK